jgi:hypothetical protein
MVLKWRDMDACKKYVDVYPEIISKNIIRGWLGPQFFCQGFLNTCKEPIDL